MPLDDTSGDKMKLLSLLVGCREIVVEEIIVREPLGMNLTNLGVDDLTQLIEIGLLARRDENTLSLPRHPRFLKIVKGEILSRCGREIVIILRGIGESVDLIENYDRGLVGAVELFESLVDNLDLLFEGGV